MSDERWGIVLAGGEGSRLRPMTLRIEGDDRPKQFCRVVGGTTLLEQTRRRAALLVPPKRTPTRRSRQPTSPRRASTGHDDAHSGRNRARVGAGEGDRMSRPPLPAISGGRPRAMITTGLPAAEPTGLEKWSGEA